MIWTFLLFATLAVCGARLSLTLIDKVSALKTAQRAKAEQQWPKPVSLFDPIEDPIQITIPQAWPEGTVASNQFIAPSLELPAGQYEVRAPPQVRRYEQPESKHTTVLGYTWKGEERNPVSPLRSIDIRAMSIDGQVFERVSHTVNTNPVMQGKSGTMIMMNTLTGELLTVGWCE